MNNNITLSICCITYNHSKHLRQCIEGFLIQKTSFPIEIIIHDDASTDGTSEIVLEYSSKYPDLIKPIIQKQNKYSTNPRILNSYVYPHAKGKYIALCEGDDYWTDPYKLQKQVDFLESHQEYVFCGHRHNIIKGETIYTNRNAEPWYEQEDNTEIDSKVLLEWWPVSTLSMVIKKDIALRANELITKCEYTYAGDIHFFYYLLKFGLGYAMHEVMAIYRIHEGGVYSSLKQSIKYDTDINIRKELYNHNPQDNNLRVSYLRHIKEKFLKDNATTLKERIHLVKTYLSASKKINEYIAGIALFAISILNTSQKSMLIRYKKKLIKKEQ